MKFSISLMDVYSSLLLLVISLQMVAFANGFTVSAVEGVAYTLLLLPIAFILITMCVLVLKICLTKKISISDVFHRKSHVRRKPTNTIEM